MLDELTEQELLDRAREGDERAFGRLLERHHERAYRTAFAILADPAVADEAAQEAFVRAWRGLPRFRGQATFATWLTRLVVNVARDHLRREKPRMLLAQALLATVRLSRTDAFKVVDDRDEVRWALRRLAPSLREVVGLRYGLELSTREVAEVLGCPEGTVKSRLHAALRALEDTLRHERTFAGLPLPEKREVDV
jgi:RNA polymerase sigma-70 factor (ECF subfamily)